MKPETKTHNYVCLLLLVLCSNILASSWVLYWVLITYVWLLYYYHEDTVRTYAAVSQRLHAVKASWPRPQGQGQGHNPKAKAKADILWPQAKAKAKA